MLMILLLIFRNGVQSRKITSLGRHGLRNHYKMWCFFNPKAPQTFNFLTSRHLRRITELISPKPTRKTQNFFIRAYEQNEVNKGPNIYTQQRIALFLISMHQTHYSFLYCTMWKILTKNQYLKWPSNNYPTLLPRYAQKGELKN